MTTIKDETTAVNPSLSLSQRALASAVAAYIVVDSLDIRLTELNNYAYALLIVVCVGGVLSSTASLRRNGLVIPLTLAVWCLYMLLQITQWPVPVHYYSSDQITDLLITLVPLAMFVVLSAKPMPPQALLRALITIGIIAYIATATNWTLTPPGQRFQSPSMFALATPWVLATQPLPVQWRRRNPLIRLLGVAGILIMLPLTLASGSRTATVTWAIAGLACMFLRLRESPSRRLANVSVALLLALVVVPSSIVDELKAVGLSMVSDSRLTTLTSGELDTSTSERIAEIEDVRAAMSAQSSHLSALVGLGHGANFTPYRSNVAQNIDLTTGMVHNVHVTPVLIWFRYGLVGLMIFTALMLAGLIRSVRMVQQRPGAQSALVLTLFLCYSLDLLVRNSLADPGWALIMAVIFSRPQDSASDERPL